MRTMESFVTSSGTPAEDPGGGPPLAEPVAASSDAAADVEVVSRAELQAQLKERL